MIWAPSRGRARSQVADSCYQLGTGSDAASEHLSGRDLGSEMSTGHSRGFGYENLMIQSHTTRSDMACRTWWGHKLWAWYNKELEEGYVFASGGFKRFRKTKFGQGDCQSTHLRCGVSGLPLADIEPT